MTARRIRVLLCVALLLPVDIVVGVLLLGVQLLAFVFGSFRTQKSNTASFAPPSIGSVTIQILNWDGRSLLEEFLPSVLAAAGPHQVVVVDNGSKDDSVAFLKKHFQSVRVVALDRNYGFSRGNNLGM